MNQSPLLLKWLLESDEPWTRYRTRLDLLAQSENDPEVCADRAAMLAHPRVIELINHAGRFPETPIRRHNDAAHPIYALSTLADFGLSVNDPGVDHLVDAIFSRQSEQGAFQSLLSIPAAFGGSGEAGWAWLACDAPILLYCLLSFGLADDKRVRRAVEHWMDIGETNGWHCRAAPQLGKFHGPGRRGDPCPIANVSALKALSLLPQKHHSPPVKAGIEMLLNQWAGSRGRKFYLFGMGSDFRKLKAPQIWFDLLHTAEALSRYPAAQADSRYQTMVQEILSQARPSGRYIAGSMYQAWKGWSFADKKNASPWLTLLALRIGQRSGCPI